MQALLSAGSTFVPALSQLVRMVAAGVQEPLTFGTGKGAAVMGTYTPVGLRRVCVAGHTGAGACLTGAMVGAVVGSN